MTGKGTFHPADAIPAGIRLFFQRGLPMYRKTPEKVGIP
jgi:hypothetical protein